ncbi:MAG: hypothetical protein ABIO46_13030, partial [Chitinophagales bacterium]
LLSSLLHSVALTAHANYSISEVRTLYGKGIEDATAAKKLFDLVSNVPNDPLLIAYRGGAEALLAKHALNPYTKLDYLGRSMNTLSLAVRADPSNAEIRFIRFSIQFYIPKFLGYSKNMRDDAHVIAMNFSRLKHSVDAKTFRNIGEFMMSSGSCGDSDVAMIQQQLLVVS